LFIKSCTIAGLFFLKRLPLMQGMKKLFLIFILCISGFFAKAQFIDSLQSAINQKGSFMFSFNSRNSFITNQDAHIFGYLVGVTFGKKISIGGGFNSLTSNITNVFNEEGVMDTARLNFTFFSYYVQYILNLTKHWKLYITAINVGIGGSSYQYNYKGTVYTINSRTILLWEPGVELDYNFNRFWGLYTQVNYRYMLINNPTIDKSFNSPTYSYGILIYPLEIFAGIFPRTKLAHMIEGN
jgi:hypothetical protein